MGLEKIAYFKKLRGITSEELSVQSGIPLSTIKKISAGITKNPSLDTVAAIAKTLKCSLDDFCDNNIGEEQNALQQNQTIKKYHLLNADGKEKVDNYIDDLLQNDKNIAATSHTTDTITPFDKFAMDMVKKAMINPKAERIKANSIK